MADKKLVDLVRQIKRATDDNSIKWEKTVDDEVFTTSISNFSIQISSEIRSFEYRSQGYVIRIFDDEGTLVEEIRDTDFSITELPGADKIMKDVHSIARRQSLGVEEVINSLLDELKKLDKTDKTPF